MRATLAKFYADRGPHLAAMIAYFALLAFVPLVFCALALVGFAGRADETSYLVTELKRIFPGSSVESIVEVVTEIQDNAAALGIIGLVGIIWTSQSLFAALESAFNIVYGRPNRSFLHGKALAFAIAIASLVGLFVGLGVGSIGVDVLEHFAPGFIGNSYVAYVLSLAISTGGVFVFLVSSYYFLTNLKVSFREVLPGAIVGTITLQVSFQVLPLYLRLSDQIVALKALGGPVLLLVWLYVMANLIVFGAEVNWWRSRGRFEVAADDRGEATGLA